MHAGSIYTDTMEARAYKYLERNPGWHSSMDICFNCWTPNVGSTISGIRQQLPENETIHREVRRWKEGDRQRKRTYYRLEVTE